MNFDWSKVSEFQSTRQIHTMTVLVLFNFWSREKQYCISLNSSRMCDLGPRMGGYSFNVEVLTSTKNAFLHKIDQENQQRFPIFFQTQVQCNTLYITLSLYHDPTMCVITIMVLTNSLPPTQIPLPYDDKSLFQYANEATAIQTDASVSNSQGVAIQQPTPTSAAPEPAMAAETDEKDVSLSHQD